MKKKLSISFIFIILIGIFTITNENKHSNEISRKEFLAGNATSTFYDWSEVTQVDSKYSYSTLFLTEKTRFEKLSATNVKFTNNTYFGNKKTTAPVISDIEEGESVALLITNCAIDKKGDILDVLVTIDNVKSYEGQKGSVGLTIDTQKMVLSDQTTPSNSFSRTLLNNGDLILFKLQPNNASANLNLTYYKAGTYVYKSNKGTLADIDSINSLFADLDIPGSSTSSFLGGNEGFKVITGSSKIYYNKNSKQVSDPNYINVAMQEIDNGLAIKNKSTKMPMGIWYATSATVLTDDITNANYSFTFGGPNESDIYYTSYTPYPYVMEKPNVNANVNSVNTSSTFEYTISQYVPNTFHSKELQYSDMITNLKSETKLKKLVLDGKIDENLSIESIAITDETGADAEEYFDKNINEDNSYNITTKTSNFDDLLFYNHIYYFKIKVGVGSNVNNVSDFNNDLKLTSQIADNAEEENDLTNPDVKMTYRLKVNYLNENLEQIAEPDIYNYENGQSYETNISKVNAQEWELTEIPSNAKGVINSDTEVNYIFKKFNDNPNTGSGSNLLIPSIIMLSIVLLILVFKKQKLFKV